MYFECVSFFRLWPCLKGKKAILIAVRSSDQIKVYIFDDFSKWNKEYVRVCVCFNARTPWLLHRGMCFFLLCFASKIPALNGNGRSGGRARGSERRISKQVIIFHPLALYAYNNLLLGTCISLSMHVCMFVCRPPDH